MSSFVWFCSSLVSNRNVSEDGSFNLTQIFLKRLPVVRPPPVGEMLAFALRKTSVVKDNFGEVRDKKQPRHGRALAIVALYAGGMVVARALVDRALGDELHDARMAMALKLGGWNNAADSHTQSFERRREKQD